MNYTIPLALQDFVPVVCAGFGFFTLAELLSRGHAQARKLAFFGASVITLGGLLKATWKLTMAVSQGAINLVVLDKQLFFSLAVGFICLATALLSIRRGSPRALPVALLCSLLAVGAGVFFLRRGGESYRVPLLLCVVLGNTITLVLAIAAARTRGLRLASYLIGAYLVTGFIMPSLARLEQTIAVQWVEQSVNSAGAIGLLLGSRLLRRFMQAAAAFKQS